MKLQTLCATTDFVLQANEMERDRYMLNSDKHAFTHSLVTIQ